MPKVLFNGDMEIALMKAYVEVFVGASGSTLTAKEKYEAIAEKVNEAGRKEGWEEVRATNVENKIDSLKRKGKKVYKNFRTRTRTGAPVDGDFDLEAAYKEWANFRVYHRLFFKHQSFGPGGNNTDTASGDEDTPQALHPPAQKRSHEDDSEDSDVEPGKKPARETTRRRSAGQGAFLDTYAKLQQQMMEAEAQREETRREFEIKMEENRRHWEDQREVEHQEREEKREQQRREYEEKREVERERNATLRMQSDREFNATLLARLFGKD